MATLAYASRWGFYLPDWGPDPSETNQDVFFADGWKQMIPYFVYVDTDGIDSGGTLTIPTTGIYYINAQAIPAWDHVGPFPSGGMIRIQQNGSTIAQGNVTETTGTDFGSSTAMYAGCLTGGDEITIEYEGNFNPHMGGYVSLMRTPSPFSIADLLVGTNDSFTEWQPVCDLPAWIDAGDATRFVVADTGYYFLTYKDLQEVVPAGFFDVYSRFVQIYVNGSPTDQIVYNPGRADNIPTTSVLSLTAGDYVQMFFGVQASTPMNLLESDIMLFKAPDTFVGAAIFLAHFVYHTTAYFEPDFDTQIYDTDSFWAGSGSSHMTVPSGQAGLYLVWASYYEFAFRAINYRIRTDAAAMNSYGQFGNTAGELFALGNPTSPTSCQIMLLDDGESVWYEIQNGDAGGDPGDAHDMWFGMMKIDGWDYPPQNQCPCPTDFLPQIYRWLKR